MNDTTLSIQSNNEPLTLDTIRKAVNTLRELKKQPFVQSINSRHEWYVTIQKSPVTYGFLIHGTPIYKDESIPEDRIRFIMSDGTHKDFPYKS